MSGEQGVAGGRCRKEEEAGEDANSAAVRPMDPSTPTGKASTCSTTSSPFSGSDSSCPQEAHLWSCMYMVAEPDTRKLYAFKTMSTGYVAKEGLRDIVCQEKDLQMSCNSPFVIQLYKTFDTPKNLCMLLEVALGGDLAATYNSHDLIGNVACVKYHSAGAMLALNYLHSVGICFRDAKPENILLNAEGQVKLGDFGCAKRIGNVKTYTICGTAAFMAPEMLSPCVGYGFDVDVFALGYHPRVVHRRPRHGKSE